MKDPKHCDNSTAVHGVYVCRLALLPCEAIKECSLDKITRLVKDFKIDEPREVE